MLTEDRVRTAEESLVMIVLGRLGSYWSPREEIKSSPMMQGDDNLSATKNQWVLFAPAIFSPPCSIILAPSVVRAGSHFRSAAAAAARFSSADERRLARRRSGRVRGGRVRGADYQGDVIAC